MIGKVFDRIQAIRPVATKTERKLIDRICEIDKKDLIYLSITDLADMLGVAEATILRFCRKLEFKGFQDSSCTSARIWLRKTKRCRGSRRA